MIESFVTPEHIEVNEDQQVLRLGQTEVHYRESSFKPLAALFAVMAIFELIRRKVGLLAALIVILPAIPLIITQAYVAPLTRATGFLVTSAVWNQDVVDNMIAVKALADKAPIGYQGAAEFSSTAAEQTLFTHPTGAMGPNDSIVGLFYIRHATAGTGSLDLDIQLGATTALTDNIANTPERAWLLQIKVSNDNSTSSQIVTLTWFYLNATYSQTTSNTTTTQSMANRTAVDTSSSVDLKATLTFSVSSPSNVAKFNGALLNNNNA